MTNDILKNRLLYLITPPEYNDKNIYYAKIESAVKGGADIVQLRNKNASTKELICLAMRILEIVKTYNGLFIINDRTDIAMAVNADGVHLGQEDMPINLARNILGPNKIIGCSTHSIDQAISAQKQGADYLGFGPIFVSPLKKNLKPIGIDFFTKLNKSISIPYFAIGGINQSNLNNIILSGANRVAVCSGIFNKNNCYNVTVKSKEKLKKAGCACNG